MMMMMDIYIYIDIIILNSVTDEGRSLTVESYTIIHTTDSTLSTVYTTQSESHTDSHSDTQTQSQTHTAQAETVAFFLLMYDNCNLS